MDMSLSKFWEMMKDRETWHAAVHRVTKSQTWLRDWIELNWNGIIEGDFACTGHKELDMTEQLNNAIFKFSGKILVYLIDQESVLDRFQF